MTDRLQWALVILRKQLNFGHGLVSAFVSPFQGSKFYSISPRAAPTLAGRRRPGLVCLAPLGLLSLRDLWQILLSITKLRTLTKRVVGGQATLRCSAAVGELTCWCLPCSLDHLQVGTHDARHPAGLGESPDFIAGGLLLRQGVAQRLASNVQPDAVAELEAVNNRLGW